jgi:hypothetical protein
MIDRKNERDGEIGKDDNALVQYNVSYSVLPQA